MCKYQYNFDYYLFVPSDFCGINDQSLFTGRIYTGTHDGKVVEITNEKEIKVIAQLGTPPCGKLML